MNSLILRTASRFVFALLLLFSLLFLVSGHDQPGGGFVAGLVAAAAFALTGIAYGVERARRNLRVDPRLLIGLGLLCAAGSGLLAVAQGRPFLTGLWLARRLPAAVPIALGTPFLFDLGVFLVVLGVVITIMLAFAEEP